MKPPPSSTESGQKSIAQPESTLPRIRKTASIEESEATPAWLALKRDDLTVMAEKFQRENHRPRQWITMLTGFASLGAGAGLASVGEALAWSQSLGPLFIAGGWAGALTCFGIAIRRERRLRAEYDVSCPSCNASLLRDGRTQLAVATGNCPSCGERLFADR